MSSVERANVPLPVLSMDMRFGKKFSASLDVGGCVWVEKAVAVALRAMLCALRASPAQGAAGCRAASYSIILCFVDGCRRRGWRKVCHPKSLATSGELGYACACGGLLCSPHTARWPGGRW